MCTTSGPSFRARASICIGLLALTARVAPADEAAAPIVAAHAASVDRPHAIYVELLGKGGLWGLGYDYQLSPRLGFGTTLSLFWLDGQRVTTVSPYVTVYPLAGDLHRWFVQAGPEVVQVATPSPVPEWPGTSKVGLGGELCSGYEYRHGFLFRAYGMAAVGRGRAAPWAGVSLGWTL